MANKKICSERMTVGDRMLSFRDYAFYVLGPDGQPRRVRHYRDTLRAAPEGFLHQDDLGRTSPAPALGIVAVPRGTTLTDTALVGILLTGARHGARAGQDEITYAAPGSEGVLFAATYDFRRNQRHRLPHGRSFTGEGGLGFLRPPAAELSMLLHSDRAGDAFYESASERATRRRSLVTRLAAEDPAAIATAVTEVKAAGLRVPAITTAVDAVVASVPASAPLLASVLTRPDDPALALKYFQETYPDRKVPSGLKRALADAAARLYDESACLRFDVTRERGVEDRATSSRSVSFRDVILLTRPVPRDEEQSALFAAIVGGYTNVAGFPVLEARRTLRNIGPETAQVVVAAAARRVREARIAGQRVDEPLTRLPWQMLVSLTATGREDVAALEADLARTRAAVRDLRHSDEYHTIFAEERRLRRLLRDRAVGLYPDARETIRRAVIDGVDVPAHRDLVEIEPDDLDAPDWISLLDEPETHAYVTAPDVERTAAARLRLAGQGIRSRVTDPTALEDRVDAYRAAAQALHELRATEAFRALRAELRPLEKNRDRLEREIRRTRQTAQPVDPNIWELAVPSMSAVEALSLLGAMGRSDVDDTVREAVQVRIESGKFMLPDILRAARGATLAESARDESPARSSLFSDRGWATMAPSSWDPMLESLLQQRLDERIGRLRGRAAIFVDGSGSMFSEVSARRGDARGEGYSSLTCAEVAAFAASAIASRCETTPDVYAYDTSATKVDVVPGASVLDAVRSVSHRLRGGGTDTERVVAEQYDGHDFIVVLTDEQTSWVPGQPASTRRIGYRRGNDNGPTAALPAGVPVIVVNLAGYQVTESGDRPGFVGISGWSEALFDAVATVSAQLD